jgi:ABC-type lipoprotein release transport system permease subunit
VLRVTVHGLQAFDLPVLAAAAVGVPVMTLLAAVSPALAASRLDPARALQTE